MDKMNMTIASRRGFWFSALLIIVALALAMGFGSGCKRVRGDRLANEAPLVWFANVPPQDQQFSTNPLVHWVGQDRDGQVVQYRYRVIKQTSMMARIHPTDSTSTPDSTDIAAYVELLIDSLDDSVWTYLTVDPQNGVPQTGVVVPLLSNLDDPVRTYVPQYVFVQAIDDGGLYSNVAYRAFLRNNNPPSTRILGFDSTVTPFIDAPQAGGLATGIKFSWMATDVQDYPTDPPPFEFQWRLYGPYDSVTFKNLENTFRKVAFVTTDARIFIQDDTDPTNDTLIFCDTAYYASGTAITCDTILIDTVQVTNLYGHLDTILNIDNPEFANDSNYNYIADSSKNGLTGWVLNTRDSIYDAFRRRPADTTQQARFIFWIRSRDDAKGPDVTPAFQSFTVVSPKYEHALLIADAERSYEINPRNQARAKLYWDTLYHLWDSTYAHGLSDDFVLSRDYTMISQASGNVLTLFQLLSHKMVIVVNDEVISGVFATPDIERSVFTALDAGVSVWMCGRAMIAGGENKPPERLCIGNPGFPADTKNAARNYYYYFGVQCYQHSGWDYFALGMPPLTIDRRIEDFIGTASLDTVTWPDLVVDTNRLHKFYGWGGDFFPWRADLGALPEVGYMISAFGTEPMHLYRSKYGAQALPDPIGTSFDGRPVMHRINRGFYRSVVSLFTPYCFTPATGNKTVLETLEWMYYPFEIAAPGTAAFYFPDGPAAISPAEGRAIHFQTEQ
jgi:hypothetical protein